MIRRVSIDDSERAQAGPERNLGGFVEDSERGHREFRAGSERIQGGSREDQGMIHKGANENSGNRFNHSSIAITNSIRAKFDPRHRWIPMPKAK